jgi:iron(III) transport system permease protein
MTRWRLALTVLFLLLVGGPLLVPLVELLRNPEGWLALAETERLLALARNTCLLVAGTLLAALPLGVGIAVLLYRTDVPGRRFFRGLVVLSLFIPLPVLAAGWQAALGSGGWLPVALWRSPDQPWAQGMGPAIWIHTAVALPWVVLLVGQGLCWVERELEEEGLLLVGPWQVLWRVTLPRCRACLAAAALWVAVQTAAEITVTSLMNVRTFAEEVFVQFTTQDAPVPRVVAVSLPAILLVWIVLVWFVPRLERSLPPQNTLVGLPRLFLLGVYRWPCLVLLLALGALLAGIPVASLVWQVGLHGQPLTWSGAEAWARVLTALRVKDGLLVLTSLAWAAACGVLAAGMALLLCWLAREARWLALLLVGLGATAWAYPGPLLGIGLKELILQMVDWTGHGVLAAALYYGPSPLPVLWARFIRFLPCALAMLWPIVRLLPRELLETARIEGARPGQELRHVVWPLTSRSYLAAALVVTALALGEITTSKLVETSSDTFAHVVYDRMHYGVRHDVAALCLVLLAEVGALGLIYGFALSGFGFIVSRSQSSAK